MSSMAETNPADVTHATALERPYSPEALRAFLEQSGTVAEWHRQRAENFESKAGTILGFSGVLLALTTQVVRPIDEVRGGWQVSLVILTASGAVAFLASAVFALRTLRAREYRYSSTAQLRRVWVEYRDRSAYEDTQVVGMFADSLICGGDGQSPIESLVDDADQRGKDLGWSISLLFVGLVLEAAVAAVLSVEVMVR